MYTQEFFEHLGKFTPYKILFEADNLYDVANMCHNQGFSGSVHAKIAELYKVANMQPNVNETYGYEEGEFEFTHFNVYGYMSKIYVIRPAGPSNFEDVQIRVFMCFQSKVNPKQSEGITVNIDECIDMFTNPTPYCTHFARKFIEEKVSLQLA